MKLLVQNVCVGFSIAPLLKIANVPSDVLDESKDIVRCYELIH